MVRKQVQILRIQWIYEQVNSNVSIDEILEQLRLE
jgi:hypothetical protein